MKYKINDKIPNSGDFIYDIFKSRGIVPEDSPNGEEINKYLDPLADYQLDCDELNNIEAGMKLLFKHVWDNDKILLIVDADSDGVTSAAIMYLFIKDNWPFCDLIWQMHEHKVHGIELDKIPEDVKLVICPDSSSNQPEEHKELKSRGIDVLVLDHHPWVPDLDDPAIIINNQDGNYQNKSLCGAGVVYKFIQKWDKIMDRSDADNYLDLVALGEISDMMDLRPIETRYIVSKGLQSINNVGFKTLLKKQEYSIGDLKKITPMSVAFYITPLINAIIRVGTMEEKELLFRAFIEGNTEILSTKRGHKEGEIETITEAVGRIGTNCRNRQNKILDEFVDYLDFKIQKEELNDHRILFIGLDEKEAEKLPSELSGLVAMRLVQKYNKPSIVTREVNDDCWGGSIRGLSNSDFNDFRGFLEKSGYFEFAQGHAQAAGCKIKKSKLDAFLEYSDKGLANYNFGDTSYVVDYEFDNESFSNIYQLAQDLDSLSTIWGQGIEEPRIAIKDLPFTQSNVQIMGKDSSSCKITKNGISFVRFKDTDFIDKVTKYDYGTITLVGRVTLNVWGGRSTAQVLIDDYEIGDDRYSF